MKEKPSNRRGRINSVCDTPCLPVGGIQIGLSLVMTTEKSPTVTAEKSPTPKLVILHNTEK